MRAYPVPQAPVEVVGLVTVPTDQLAVSEDFQGTVTVTVQVSV